MRDVEDQTMSGALLLLGRDHASHCRYDEFCKAVRGHSQVLTWLRRLTITTPNRL